ncbi:MAG: transposase family protein, partial [Dehalococcoidia bacterium]
MSPARRLTVEALDRRNQARREAQRRLREQNRARGLIPPPRSTESNRKSEFQTVDQERAAREEATVEHARILRTELPRLLGRLAEIPDPRQPKRIRHKLALLILYGILMFVYQMSSRREANRTMTRPMFLENLRSIFPEIDELPHQDTLHRLLCEIEVDHLEALLYELVRDLIRRKKFRRYRVESRYVIAIDG